MGLHTVSLEVLIEKVYWTVVTQTAAADGCYNSLPANHFGQCCARTVRVQDPELASNRAIDFAKHPRGKGILCKRIIKEFRKANIPQM